MWSSRRIVLGGLAALALTGLAGCSGLTPVYDSPRLSSGDVRIAYPSPSNRTELLIYQDLALKLPRGGDGDPHLAVSASASSRSLTGNRIGSPLSQSQVVVTASITLTDADGKVLFSGTRSASADYATTGQILASNAAAADATNRAAHSLADIIRLSVLGALGQ